MNAQEIIDYMLSLSNEAQSRQLMRFFKTAEGQYGYGDKFLGIKNPQVHEIVRHASGISRDEVTALIHSPWHEIRLCGFLILVDMFLAQSKKSLVDTPAAIRERDEIVSLYIKEAEYANNWDLVDLSVIKIIGGWILLPSALGDEAYKQSVIDDLADSPNLWRQRMSVVCTWKTSQAGNPDWCLRYSLRHLHHPHDLMHKAVGWMLREMGKGCGVEVLRSFLDEHVSEMNRTTLRYAIERLPLDERLYWMKR
jgi:3-methyladenine DNA glycosylase AlkD